MSLYKPLFKKKQSLKTGKYNKKKTSSVEVMIMEGLCTVHECLVLCKVVVYKVQILHADVKGNSWTELHSCLLAVAHVSVCPPIRTALTWSEVSSTDVRNPNAAALKLHRVTDPYFLKPELHSDLLEPSLFEPNEENKQLWICSGFSITIMLWCEFTFMRVYIYGVIQGMVTD